MKECDGFSFGINAPEGPQTEQFENVLHSMPGLMSCCILHKADLDCFGEGHP